MSTTVRTIGATARQHASIAIWEAATDNDLVTGTVIEEGHMYDDADFEEEDLLVGGATTSALYYRHLRAAAGEEHDPIADVGCWITGEDTYILIQEHYFRASYFGIRRTKVASFQNVIITDGVLTGFRFNNLFVVRTGNGGVAFLVDGADDTEIVNCISIQPAGSAGGKLVYQVTAGKDVNVFNSVCYFGAGATNGTGYHLRGTGDIRNCISVGAPQNDFDVTIGGTESNNISSDATANGTGSVINQKAANLFVDAANNFRLKAGCAAIDEGADLSGDGVDVDFTGAAREGLWDIGAYMASAVLGALKTSAFYYYYLYRR